MKQIIIAIDGFSSCGKSSFAKLIADKYNYIFIDSGAMYRAVTLYALENNIINNGVIDREKLISQLNNITIFFKNDVRSGTSATILNGKDVSQEIRSLEVNKNVSPVSSIKEVRNKMVLLQKEMGNKRGVVMDGRDIGTTVFPNAELKIFMTASVDVRIERRYKELTDKSENVSLEEIKENILYRDNFDQTRDESPLKMADDAILLDNSNMSISEQMDWFDDIFTKLNA